MRLTLDIIKKILDTSIFGPSDIEYSVNILDWNFKYQADVYKKYVNITVYVDLEKFMPVGSSYNSSYESSMYELEETLDVIYGLLGLSDGQIHLNVEYINFNSINKILDRMTNKLRGYINHNYNVPLDDLTEVRYYFYGSESENPFVKIEVDLYEFFSKFDVAGDGGTTDIAGKTIDNAYLRNDLDDISKEIFYGEKLLSGAYDLDIIDF